MDVLEKSPQALISGQLNVRWLGKVSYGDGLELQRGLFKRAQAAAQNTPAHLRQNYLLLLEHPPVYTFGKRGSYANMLAKPQELGAEEYWVDRGGDVTFHGPGQLVGYPIFNLAGEGSGLIHTARYVRQLEELLMDALSRLGVNGAHTQKKFPGVWVSPNESKKTASDAKSTAKKIASIGVRLSKGVTMHGFALNVCTDLDWFSHIVPCGIKGAKMTSIQAEISQAEICQDDIQAEISQAENKNQPDSKKSQNCESPPQTIKPTEKQISLEEVAELIAELAQKQWGDKNTKPNSKSSTKSNSKSSTQSKFNTQAWALTSSQQVKSAKDDMTLNAINIHTRKPSWLRAPVKYSSSYMSLKKTLRDLPTVCEEAACPNLFECWGEGTATFMINGDRCTRNCGFCLVNTQKPQLLDASEPERLAAAARQMGLKHIVITAVARDDLADGGAGAFADSILAVRRLCPEASVEVLIPDFKGQPEDLETVFAHQPDVLNHNLETVLRLQKIVRPQAGYARSLSVLARAKAAGLTTKSSLMVGLGETMPEIKEAIMDLAAVGTDILTIGQYLRPSKSHLPVIRWWEPEDFEELAEMGSEFDIGHIEAGPLVRSSYMAGKVKSVAGV